MSAVSSELSRSDASSISELNKLDLEKIEECRQHCKRVEVVLTECLILINISTQRLHLLAKNGILKSYRISTAAKGAGQEEGSNMTPLGFHRVQDKIGDGADPFAVFKSRKLTGNIALPEAGGNAIVGRILWLQGLQPGFNQGNNSEGTVVDTYSRHIYIHGTNDAEDIGKAVSIGCIRMLPCDVIDLFNRVTEGTPVHIYQA